MESLYAVGVLYPTIQSPACTGQNIALYSLFPSGLQTGLPQIFQPRAQTSCSNQLAGRLFLSPGTDDPCGGDWDGACRASPPYFLSIDLGPSGQQHLHQLLITAL